MLPTLSNLLKFSPNTYWLSPPSLLGFCSSNTQKCFRERVTIFMKKPRQSVREMLFFVLFKLEFRIFTGVLNAAMWNIFAGTLLQRTKYWTLFTDVLPKCYKL